MAVPEIFEKLTEGAGFEIEIATFGRDCRVTIDGHDVSRYVQRVVILADVRQITRIRLSCIHKGEPFVVRGKMVAH